MRTIIAIGGGGFTAAADPELDGFVLERGPAEGARIGYIGTASGDDPVRIAHFHALLAPRARRAVVIPGDCDAGTLAAALTGLDILYVGGGDTRRLIDRWRAHGIDAVLADAWRRGLVLAGVSAGAAVWFERALVRDGAHGLRAIDGLGFLPGSVCAHHSSEPDRRAAFPAAVAAGALPAGIAIDDGVACLFTQGAGPRAWSARPGAWAYAVAPGSDGGASAAPLAAVNG